MAANDNQSGQAGPHPNHPVVLPPAPGNADPAPLIEALARVALAIARRRAEVSRASNSATKAQPNDSV